MPAVAISKMDTVFDGVKLKQFFITTENGTIFIAQKTRLESIGIDKNLTKLPYNLKSLNEYYGGVASGVIKQSTIKRRRYCYKYTTWSSAYYCRRC